MSGDVRVCGPKHFGRTNRPSKKIWKAVDNSETIKSPLLQLFKIVWRTTGSLCRRLSERALPNLCHSDPLTVFKEISSRTDPKVAQQVAEAFNNHLLVTNARLTGFRVSVVYPFDSDDEFWLLLIRMERT